MSLRHEAVVLELPARHETIVLTCTLAGFFLRPVEVEPRSILFFLLAPLALLLLPPVSREQRALTRDAQVLLRRTCSTAQSCQAGLRSLYRQPSSYRSWMKQLTASTASCSRSSSSARALASSSLTRCLFFSE